jgi:NADH-quinone oxidoreductase subunit M
MKKLIAYSSVAHMGDRHGRRLRLQRAGPRRRDDGDAQPRACLGRAVPPAVGIIYDRLHTREIDRYGGLSINMPRYALFFMLFTMASVGLPGTSGFVAEFLSLAGIYQVSTWVGLRGCTTGIILGAAYMLYLYRRVAFR